MTTLTRANQITSEIRESVDARLAEINEMFEMGFINNIEKYEMSQEVKSELTSYFNLSR